jgi:hypothetical protein
MLRYVYAGTALAIVMLIVFTVMSFPQFLIGITGAFVFLGVLTSLMRTAEVCCLPVTPDLREWAYAEYPELR